MELAPPLFVCVTDVEDVLLDVAAPVVTEALLFPVFDDVAPFDAALANQTKPYQLPELFARFRAWLANSDK